MAEAQENLVHVARTRRRLGLVDAVIVGGATVGSTITDPAARPLSSMDPARVPLGTDPGRRSRETPPP